MCGVFDWLREATKRCMEIPPSRVCAKWHRLDSPFFEAPPDSYPSLPTNLSAHSLTPTSKMRFPTIVIALVCSLAAVLHPITARLHQDLDSGNTRPSGYSTTIQWGDKSWAQGVRQDSKKVIVARQAKFDMAYWNEMLDKSCSLIAGMANGDYPESSFTNPCM